MTPRDQKTRNDVIEFATILYGSTWRKQLARALGTTSQNLDHLLAVQKPLPDSVLLGIANLMKTHLETRRRDQEELDLRVTTLLRQIATPIRRAAKEEGPLESSETLPRYGAHLRLVDQSSVDA